MAKPKKKTVKVKKAAPKAKGKSTTKKKRRKPNRWVQLKSIIWNEVKKDSNTSFEYQSKAFNNLVSETYRALGYKDKVKGVWTKHPKSLGRQVNYAVYGVLQSVNVEETSYAITYWQIDQTLRDYKDNKKHPKWNVRIELTTDFPITRSFKIEDYNYFRTGLRNFVADLDRVRKLSGNQSTPTPTVKVTEDSLNKTIILSDLYGDSSSGKALANKAITDKTLSPTKVRGMYKRIDELKAEIKALTAEDKKYKKKFGQETLAEGKKLSKKAIMDMAYSVKETKKNIKSNKAELKLLENQIKLNAKAKTKGKK